MQLAERGLTGHPAAGQYANATQTAASLVHVQLDAAFMALRYRDHDHAVVPRTAEAGEELRVVTGSGATAIALENQALNAAVDQAIHNLGTDTGKQWQHGNIRQLPWLVVTQCGGSRNRLLATTLTRQTLERMPAKTAYLRAARRIQQLPVEVQVYARRQALAQGNQRAAEVFPGITVSCAGRKH